MRRPLEDSTYTQSQHQESRCACCNKIYKTRHYNICDDPRTFAAHGFGISLYYILMRYLLYICGILLFWCAALMVMYVNGGVTELTIGKDTEIQEEERVAFPNYGKTLANEWSIGRIRQEEVSNALLIGGAGMIFIFYFAWVQMNALLNSCDTELNIDNLTPADYTVSLTGVPVDIMNEEEIKRDFLMNLNGNPELLKSTNKRIEVFKITSAYDLVEYDKIRTKLSDLRVKKQVIQNYRRRAKESNDKLTDAELGTIYPKGYEKCNYSEISEKYAELKRKILVLTQPGELKRLPQVFISFTRTVANDVVEMYKGSSLHYIFGMAKYKMKGQKVYVAEAPEPEDVMWENLGYTSMQRLCRVVLNGFITLIIMGVCLVANIFITKASKKYSENKDSSTVVLILFNLLFSFITMIVNAALSYTIPILTVYERHGSQTAYYCSVAIKLSLALFLNSAIIPVITYEEEVYFTSGGFLTTIWMNWLFVCFFNPFLEIFDPWYLLACASWYLVKSKGANSTLTQREANIALEPYEISIVTKYAQLMNIMFYTSFYAFFFPPGIVITIAGIFINYWVSKYLMINRYKVPRISGDIALYCMHFMGWFFPIFSLVAAEVFIARFKTSIMENQLLGIVLPIALLIAMFSLSYCLKHCSGKGSEKSCLYKLFVGDNSFVTMYFDRFKNVEYNPFTFMTSDYKISNPVTREEGLKELTDYCSRNAKTEEQKVVANTLNTRLTVPAAFTNFTARPLMPMNFYQPRPPVSIYTPMNMTTMSPMAINPTTMPMHIPQPSNIYPPLQRPAVYIPRPMYQPAYAMPQVYQPGYAPQPMYRPYVPSFNQGY
eukprot:TRINITY_DN9389_c0_g1_i3.p1 TRINITY_DN9389_c0_g1~~TRINITY_DN9389_c0_g1_i3.p1  ORF type:complete len:832 (-),score=219.91 TRINITY_DN9389_c0_g1_i3:124-2619(-)